MGSRSESSTLRSNSGSSSKNSTPLCASEISPGLGFEEPPTKATAEQVWCGFRKGRWRQLFKSIDWPIIEYSAAVDIASSSDMVGIIVAIRCASIDLPVPGGPKKSRLWPPAAAISSTRLAPGWPLTSLKSSKKSGDWAQSGYSIFKGSGC